MPNTEFIVQQNTALYMLANAIVASRAECDVAKQLRQDIIDTDPGDIGYESATRALDVLSAAKSAQADYDSADSSE